jgi:hypothetical protein
MNNFNISIDREKFIINISFKKCDYEEKDFDEFLILFESTWVLIKKEN